MVPFFLAKLSWVISSRMAISQPNGRIGWLDPPGLVDLRPHLSLWFGGTSPSKVRQRWWWGWSCPAYEEYPNKSDITSNKYISESVHFRVFQIRSSRICPVWMYNSSLVAMPPRKVSYTCFPKLMGILAYCRWYSLVTRIGLLDLTKLNRAGFSGPTWYSENSP